VTAELSSFLPENGAATAEITAQSLPQETHLLYHMDGILWVSMGAWYPAGFHALARGMVATTFPAIRQYAKARQNALTQGILPGALTG
jgi:hypothetical protein